MKSPDKITSPGLSPLALWFGKFVHKLEEISDAISPTKIVTRVREETGTVVAAAALVGALSVAGCDDKRDPQEVECDEISELGEPPCTVMGTSGSRITETDTGTDTDSGGVTTSTDGGTTANISGTDSMSASGTTDGSMTNPTGGDTDPTTGEPGDCVPVAGNRAECNKNGFCGLESKKCVCDSGYDGQSCEACNEPEGYDGYPNCELISIEAPTIEGDPGPNEALPVNMKDFPIPGNGEIGMDMVEFNYDGGSWQDILNIEGSTFSSATGKFQLSASIPLPDGKPHTFCFRLKKGKAVGEIASIKYIRLT